jgi:hypothetical protein
MQLNQRILKNKLRLELLPTSASMRVPRASRGHRRPTPAVVAIFLGVCRLVGSTPPGAAQCQDVRGKEGWCQQIAPAGCSRPNVRTQCQLSCGLCPGAPATLRPQAARDHHHQQPEATLRPQARDHDHQQPSPVSRGQLGRAVLEESETIPEADSSGARAVLQNGTTGEAAAVEAEPSLTTRVLTFAAGIAIVGAAVSYVNSRRRKHRRRTKATMLRDILNEDEDDDDDDDGPLLGSLSSARYRGQSGSNSNLSQVSVT